MVTVVPLLHFNPVAYIVNLLPDFPEMPSWAFPTELKAGIAGVLEYLHEDDHLFSSPSPPPVPPHRAAPDQVKEEELEEELKVLTEFFPGTAYPYPYSADYSSSTYSSPSSYSQEGIYSLEAGIPVYPSQEPLYQGNIHLDTQVYNVSPPPPWIYAPTIYQTIHQESHIAAALRTNNTPHTPPYTPRNGKKTPPVEAAPQKGKISKSEEVCANCQTRESPMWRWNPNGQRECNACNLYEAGKGVKRPPTLWKQKILRRRKRNPKVLAEGQNTRSAPY